MNRGSRRSITPGGQIRFEVEEQLGGRVAGPAPGDAARWYGSSGLIRFSGQLAALTGASARLFVAPSLVQRSESMRQRVVISVLLKVSSAFAWVLFRVNEHEFVPFDSELPASFGSSLSKKREATTICADFQIDFLELSELERIAFGADK